MSLRAFLGSTLRELNALFDRKKAVDRLKQDRFAYLRADLNNGASMRQDKRAWTAHDFGAYESPKQRRIRAEFERAKEINRIKPAELPRWSKPNKTSKKGARKL